MNHNYLFFWPRWTGKTTVARILAKAVNCLQPQNWNPCNACPNCETINKGVTLDYVEIDAASHTWVDNIREEILDKVSYQPTNLKKKIYVIDEVHMLSKWAFNALLKTIEEPKDHMCFILATTEFHKIPDTILSRCQVFNFKKVPWDNIIDHLKWICDKETLAYEQWALQIIAKISEWCVRDAIKYIDQVSVLWDVTEKNITRFLGIAWETSIKTLIQIIKEKDSETLFKEIDGLAEQGIDLHQFAKQTLMYIDQHFLEDINFYMTLSQWFSDIISMIRYYPYPTMAYKIILHKHMQWWSDDTNKKTVTIPSQKKEEPVKEEVVENKKEPFTWPISKDNLMELFCERIESSVLRNNIRDHSFIQGILEEEVEFVVISKLTITIMEKEENKKHLENILSDLLWRPIRMHITLQNKEDYLHNSLI